MLTVGLYVIVGTFAWTEVALHPEVLESTDIGKVVFAYFLLRDLVSDSDCS